MLLPLATSSGRVALRVELDGEDDVAASGFDGLDDLSVRHGLTLHAAHDRAIHASRTMISCARQSTRSLWEGQKVIGSGLGGGG
jgi:hypothetical protein